MTRGTLFLVVGPSGAGKDTLLEGAQAALASDARYVFVQRAVTRPVGSGGENHSAMTSEEFEAARENGAFLLSWSAHGLDYGVPATYAEDLSAGLNVVANVSRSAIEDAKSKADPVVVIVVTAPAEILAKRLAKRGREDEKDIADRLKRQGAAVPQGIPTIEINTDCAVEESIRRFVGALLAVEGRSC